MILKKLAICAAVLVAATIASQLAQAGSKGGPSPGVSGSSPGHITPPAGSHGKSENAPGDIKHDTGAANAKELAPGPEEQEEVVFDVAPVPIGAGAPVLRALIDSGRDPRHPRIVWLLNPDNH